MADTGEHGADGLKFGIVVVPEHPAEDDQAARLAEMVEQGSRAASGGLDSVWAGQHYLSDIYAYYQPVPLLGALSVAAPGLTLGTSVILLGLQHSVRIAEEIATLDALTGGRVVAGVGLGYRDLEFDVLGQPKEDRVAAFEEAVELLARLLDEEPDPEFHGTYFDVPRTPHMTKPIQRPRPPIWMAANSNGGVRRAARMADAWFVNNHSKLETLQRQMAMYRAELERLERPFPAELPIIKELYVAETDERARTECGPYIEAKYQGFQKWGQDSVIPEEDGFRLPFLELAKDRFIVGDPDTCAEGIVEHVQALGVNHFVFRVQWPGMPQQLVLDSMDLLSTEVIPRVKALVGDSVRA